MLSDKGGLDPIPWANEIRNACAIAGEPVQNVISKYCLDVVLVNSGVARFNFDEPITFDKKDELQTTAAVKPGARVIVVHMVAVNHCYLSRAELKDELNRAGMAARCGVPADGETMVLTK